MKIRKARPALNEARILEGVRACGPSGTTARDLAKRLREDPIAVALALGRLNRSRAVRSEWTPNRAEEAGGPLQFALYIAEPAPG